MDATETHATDDEVERVVVAGPRGALALAGAAALVLMVIWFGFYFLAFLPRGIIH